MSQCDLILNHLLKGYPVTPLVAYELTGSLACHSRISELRERGYHIDCNVHHDGRTKYGVYTLVSAHYHEEPHG